MKALLIIISILSSQYVSTQTVLNADGPGNTYTLITSVLAPGYNPIEAPDCSHSVFGEHIDEIFDPELNTNVFRFLIHVSPDDDRCINSDRQRNEIKTYDKSPDVLLGEEFETVIYKWKLKLADGFQSSSNFTHLHQLKSVGGSLASMPMYTLTARKASPDRLELRYAETDNQITLSQTDLLPLIDTWIDITETVTYGIDGSYAIVIKKVSDNSILFSYANDHIINWRTEAEFVRPKWGIYRSLINSQDLRDEAVLFANFSIEEVPTLSIINTDLQTADFYIAPNPVKNILRLKNLPLNANLIQITSMDGKNIMDKSISLKKEVRLDVSTLSAGSYIVTIKGNQLIQSKTIVISKK